MRKTLFYILAIGALSSCTDDSAITNPYLNGTEKTPIEVEVSVGTNNTRAVNKEFEKGDKLLAYLRHVTWTGNDNDVPSLVTPGTPVPSDFRSPSLITFVVGDTPGNEKVDDNTNRTTNLTVEGGLYWDDFSRGAIGDDTHLRTDGHYLQSYYGYCYNGGTPSTELNEETSVLKWTIDYDQATKGVKMYDLLWSGPQTPVSYNHADTYDGNHKTLTIPYTHAMSMITVNLKGGEGYLPGHFKDTWVELQSVMKTCTVNALNQAITAISAGSEEGKNGFVKMSKGTLTTVANKPNCTYKAIVVPETRLALNALFLKIFNADGNDFDVKVNSDMLSKWNAGLTQKTIDETSYYLFRSGYNYELNITIDKVGVTVESTLADWNTLEATGTGEIQFPEEEIKGYEVLDSDGKPTIVNVEAVENSEKAKFKIGSSFDVYRQKENTSSYSFGTTSTNKEVNSKKKWVNAPDLYWENSYDKYYYRALAIYELQDPDTKEYLVTAPTGHSIKAEQGTDLVWATTPAHIVKKTGSKEPEKYAKDAPILPRTGDVPLAFEHIMSKISFELETTTDDSKVNFTNAKITITNLSTEGTVKMDNGEIELRKTDDSEQKVILTEEAVTGTVSADGKTTIIEQIVIPQSISETSKVIIQLKDKKVVDSEGNESYDYGTTYSLQLKTCMIKDTLSPISEWFGGTHYQYIIHLEKDKIDFRALIKDWDPVNGGGKATLEWD